MVSRGMVCGGDGMETKNVLLQQAREKHKNHETTYHEHTIQRYNLLQPHMKSRPWDFTEHGRKVLQTEDELNAYITAYGEMHVIKCRAALQNFPFGDYNEGSSIQERENTHALIYTALTRAKQNLFILNLGNSDYHSFFASYIG